jgi:hypothetical protein
MILRFVYTVLGILTIPLCAAYILVTHPFRKPQATNWVTIEERRRRDVQDCFFAVLVLMATMGVCFVFYVGYVGLEALCK